MNYLKNGDMGIVMEVWRQDFTKFVHNTVGMRHVLIAPALIIEQLAIGLLLMV